MKQRSLTILLAVLALAVLAPQTAFAARSLYVGASGSDVVALQKELISLGYSIPAGATGYYGAQTRAAVEKFQCDYKVICSGSSVTGYGIYGPHTQAAMSAAAQPSQPAQINTAALTPKATGKFEVSAWVPGWNRSTSTADAAAHFSQLTSVMPFGYTVTAEGTLMDTAQLLLDPWPSFIAAAHKAGVRVVPTVEWGNGAQEQAVLSDTQKRIALENTIADLVKQKGFDGIDIDFEAKEAQTINYFSTFLKGLYWRMGQKWVYCTIESRMPLEDRYLPGTTVPADATERANDFVEMNKYCDRIEIMAYDQGTVDVRLDAARSAPYAPVADPGWVEDVVDLAAQTISRNKIILGIPTYGYEYKVTPKSGGTYQYDRLWALTPTYALKVAGQFGITPGRTSANELGFVYNPSSSLAVGPGFADLPQVQNTNETPTTSIAQNLSTQSAILQAFNFVTWSDAQAIQDKVDLAKKLGVRGVALFSLGAEDPGTWNVLPTVR